ncbi:MAG TPA: hypothetical protein PLN45_02140 [Exilispira sp.]|nr:hypothetical protein [Exilispira sp.]HPO60326.1 hypothetical protein [Exilispira sp.]
MVNKKFGIGIYCILEFDAKLQQRFLPVIEVVKIKKFALLYFSKSASNVAISPAEVARHNISLLSFLLLKLFKKDLYVFIQESQPYLSFKNLQRSFRVKFTDKSMRKKIGKAGKKIMDKINNIKYLKILADFNFYKLYFF